jgi:hypothetical protein
MHEFLAPARKPTIGCFSRLIVAFAAFAICIAPLHAADITGARTVVLEGKIEAGDYDKLKSLYGERGHHEFDLGLSYANELSLASPGGDLTEAMKIGRFVRTLKLHTIVPSRIGSQVNIGIANVRPKNPKANYMCASACFFVFVAGINRTADFLDDAILGIHRPYLSDSDLRTLSGDQAIISANQVRTTVENYLREMSVPAKYTDLMFSVPKDKVRWIGDAEFHSDLEGTIPELKDWLAARCDKRTNVEKAIWEKMMADPRPIGQQSAGERSIFDMMEKKMAELDGCKAETLNELSADAWLQMFDPKCTIIRQDIVDWALAPTAARTFCDRQR